MLCLIALTGQGPSQECVVYDNTVPLVPIVCPWEANLQRETQNVQCEC